MIQQEHINMALKLQHSMAFDGFAIIDLNTPHEGLGGESRVLLDGSPEEGLLIVLSEPDAPVQSGAHFILETRRVFVPWPQIERIL